MSNTGRTDDITCLTCDVVTEYVDLANSFTQNLSSVLLDPMWFIYLSVVGLWIVIHGGKMIMGKGDLIGFAHEFAFITIAGLLLGGQGPTLVNSIYQMALSTMGSAAGVVLSAGMEGGIATAKIPSEASSLGGMAQLVYVAEKGLMVVLRIAFEIWASISLGNLMAGVYGVLLALPYIILIIVYFSQVVVSIFRVMMFSALSPILMLALGFGWGRGMAITGIRTVFAAFMVLFGSTLALALCLYGAASLDIQNTENVREITSIDNPGLWVAIVLGWMGTAFMAEATGMANSIAGSQLTNQAAAVITAGMTATGLTVLNHAKQFAPSGLKTAGNALAAGAKGFGIGQAAMSDPGGALNAAKGQFGRFGSAFDAHRQSVMERLKTPSFDRGDKS